LNSEFSREAAVSDLQRRVRHSKSLSRGTIKNWFFGENEPKYGDDDRRRMYAIAFALELDCEGTEKLFNKVFLDRAFNKRNIREFIYLHCIYNCKPLSVARDLLTHLDSIDLSDIPEEGTVNTQYLADAARKNMGEHEIVEFLSNHQYNFTLNNTAAYKHRDRLLKKLKSERSNNGNDGIKGLAEKEYERRRTESPIKKDEGFDSKRPYSNDFLLLMIMGVDYAHEESTDIISIRERFKRREISTQFPDKQTIGDDTLSSYALRKVIILLYFYDYWVSDFLGNMNEGDYDGFVDGLNDVLDDCGYSPLYVGNPYDWLFLYCSSCNVDEYTPLDRFRGILAPV
jgi:hypothetical protein